ncbi:MAG: GC-type dockerin domain-anchored protein [Phycisphaerales bacterium]|nr:GC-type dockerin domain-anchored protein [Phycisphaerales bacterium]
MKLVLSIAVAVLSSGVVVAGPTTESMKITPADLAQSDLFGTSAAASEGVVVIGSRLNDDPSLNKGAAYLFDTQSGEELLKLITSDNAQGGNFGVSVGIDMLASPPIVVVGKDQDRDNGVNAGAIYMFRVDTGAELFKLTEPDGSGGNRFGSSVDIDQETFVVGATQSSVNGPNAGRAYLFDVSTGSLLHILNPQTPISNSLFGSSVSICGDHVLVGARREPELGSNSGVAYLFDRSTGLEVARFFPSDGGSGDQFGTAVAISGDFAVISAPGDGDNGPASGSVYVFDITIPSAPAQVQRLLAPDGSAADEFGHSVDIQSNDDGFLVAVGAWKDTPSGDDSGSAYLFELDAMGVMQSSTKLLPSDSAEDTEFGTCVAIDSNGIVIVGAAEDDAIVGNGGAAYLYHNDAGCVADFNGDGTTNFFDVSAFLAAFQAMNFAADLNGDGTFNFFDISEFLSQFGEGCL